jgi:diguanylate cyclase (GGDEF)-like protein/PAS domain S-box-containing protein
MHEPSARNRLSRIRPRRLFTAGAATWACAPSIPNADPSASVGSPLCSVLALSADNYLYALEAIIAIVVIGVLLYIARRRTLGAMSKAMNEQVAILDSSLVGVMVLKNRIITRVNRRMAEMLGYEPAELEGQGPEQLHLSMKNFHDFGSRYYWRLGEGEILDIEYPLRHKDGRTVWCRFNGKAIAPPDLAHGAVWVIEDITKWKKIEEERARTIDELKTILGCAPFGVVVVGRDRVIRWANKYAAERVGLEGPEAMCGCCCEQLLCESGQYGCPVIDHGEIVDRSERVIRHEDGAEIPILKTVTPITLGGEDVLLETFVDISARKQAEDDLKEALDFTRTLLSSLPTPVFVKDRERRYVDCNEAFSAAMEVRVEDIRGRRAEEIWPGEHAEVYRRMDEEQLRTGERQEYEGEVPGADGTSRDVLFVKNVYYDSHDEPIGIIGAFIDITERRRMERRLQSSESRMRAISESAQDAIVMMDPKGRVSFWNPAAERLFGYAEEETLGRNVHELLADPKQRYAHDANVARFRRTGEGPAVGRVVELEALCKNGDRVSVELSLSSFRLDDGWHAVGIIRDVTARKQAESNLRLQSRAMEQCPSSMVITDPSGRITYVNPAFTHVTGYSADEAIGENPRILKSDLMPAKVYEDMWSTLDRGEIWRGELRNRKKNGELFWELASISPILDESGQCTHYVAVKEEITLRKKLEEQLRFAAENDKLTGLANRALLMCHLEHALERSKRHPEHRFGVLFLDADRFKVINDSLGHDAGDALIKELGNRIVSTIRKCDAVGRGDWEDTVGRFGGDEFVVLLDGLKRDGDADVVARRLLDSLSEPYRIAGHEIVTTVSIGVVGGSSAYENADDMLRDADTAMYEAKAAGKGRAVRFDVAMRRKAEDRMLIENDLRAALERDELSLVYQPIVDLATGTMHGAEALIRWTHPERGLVMPDDFVPIAEETGLIVPIGAWVLREACRQLRHWIDAFPDNAPESVSVNLARRQLTQEDLVDVVRDALRESNLSPDQLCLEITEREIMDDEAVAERATRALRDAGVRVAIDDFGTGHSSLASLRHFSIDSIKMDRRFIANLTEGRDLAALAHAVTELARNLDISVVAEGVENREQLLMLQTMDCTFGQGYLFSRPIPAERIPAFRTPAELLHRKSA